MKKITTDISDFFVSGNIGEDIRVFDASAKANVPNYIRVSYTPKNSTSIDFIFSIDVQQSHIDSLNAALNAHISNSLNILRADRIKAIDANTQKLIYKSVTFDNKRFSMSDIAQRNWIAIKASLDIYDELNAWPVPVTCEPDDEYLLTSAEHAKSFATAMLMSVAVKYNSGRVLKIAISDATTKEAIDAIVDNR